MRDNWTSSEWLKWKKKLTIPSAGQNVKVETIFLLRMQNDKATLRDNMGAFYKIKHTLAA